MSRAQPVCYITRVMLPRGNWPRRAAGLQVRIPLEDADRMSTVGHLVDFLTEKYAAADQDDQDAVRKDPEKQCRQCLHVNRPAAKFCAQCGTPLRAG